MVAAVSFSSTPSNVLHVEQVWLGYTTANQQLLSPAADGGLPCNRNIVVAARRIDAPANNHMARWCWHIAASP